jgi:hypothetical protein
VTLPAADRFALHQRRAANLIQRKVRRQDAA